MFWRRMVLAFSITCKSWNSKNSTNLHVLQGTKLSIASVFSKMAWFRSNTIGNYTNTVFQFSKHSTTVQLEYIISKQRKQTN